MTTTYANMPWFNILFEHGGGSIQSVISVLCVLHLVRDLEISWEHLRILCNMLCALEWMHREKNETKTLYCMLHLHLDSTLSCSVSVPSTDDAIIYGYLKSCSYVNKKKDGSFDLNEPRPQLKYFFSYCCRVLQLTSHWRAQWWHIHDDERKKEIEKLQQIIFLELCERGCDVCSIVAGSGAREKKLSRHM